MTRTLQNNRTQTSSQTNPGSVNDVPAVVAQTNKIKADDLLNAMKVLDNFSTHTHTIVDGYSTECDCNCNCRCACLLNGCKN